MPDAEVLATIASIVTAAGITMLFFRVQREIGMGERDEITWIAFADWLLIGATLTAVAVVLLPILLFDSELLSRRIPIAGCTAALVCMGGYVLALPAHYRLVFGSDRIGPRTNPEPAERVIVVGAAMIALVLFGASLISTACR